MSSGPLSVERWRQVENILVACWELPPESRDAFLVDSCGPDRELLREVRTLYEAAGAADQWKAPPEEDWPVASERRLGPYRLERLLGRGGAGAVYLARRVDGDFEQFVAIKIIGLPLELEIFRERFRRERRILAALNHPNITRLLDGGITADGQLYLVMEYVDGVAIDKFPADLNRRLDLFGGVCAAVQYAHQNLVIHRDIKPSNILVDASGVPKLLDFGAAKLMAETDAPVTRFGMITVAYASPEQLRGEPATTLSDVYSLGAVLYELVAEQRPFSDDPASRLRGEDSGIGKLPKPLPGDLEQIVRKALAPDPAARYSSAEQLAEDVRRYRQGEPVMAHPPAFRYRAGKFVRRNKLAVGAAALLVLTLLAGIGGILWQARTANAERAKAEARAADLRKLSDSLLTEIYSAIQQLPGSTAAQKLLVGTVLEHLKRTAEDSAADPQLRLDAVNGYIRLANVQGNRYYQHTGDMTGALNNVDRALAIASELARNQPRDVAVKRAVAFARKSRSEILFGLDRTPEAVVDMRAAVAAFAGLASLPAAGVDASLDAAAAHMHLGDELGRPGYPSLGDLPGALAEYGKAGEIYRRLANANPGNANVLQAVIENHRMMGALQLETDPGSALSEIRAAIDAIHVLRTMPGQLAYAQEAERLVSGPHAGALMGVGQYREALAAIAKSEPIVRARLAADPDDVRAIQNMWAVLSRKANCYIEPAEDAPAADVASRTANSLGALAVLTEERSLLERIIRFQPRGSHWKAALGSVLMDTSRRQYALQRPEQAAESARQAIALLKEAAGSPDAQAADFDAAADGLGAGPFPALLEPPLAVKYAERAVELSRHRNPEFLLTLSRAYRAAGESAKSRAAADEGLALLPPARPDAVRSRIWRLLSAQAAR